MKSLGGDHGVTMMQSLLQDTLIHQDQSFNMEQEES